MTTYNKDKIVTFKDYVYTLCKAKGISIKELSEEVNIPYNSLKSHIYVAIGLERRIQIIKYLDGDLAFGLTLPINENKKGD